MVYRPAPSHNFRFAQGDISLSSPIMSTAIIIPARWGSTRFPGKSLHPILGKPLIQHVWERCVKARSVDQVIIATDDMRIAETAFDFGAEVTLTSSQHPSGTDRLAEVAKRLKDVRHIINVQGDEPTIDVRLIDRIARSMQEHPEFEMVTAACPFPDADTAADPNYVKVVTSLSGRALYFSRSRIPFDRDVRAGSNDKQTPFLWHIGIYGYHCDFLSRFVRWKPTALEKREKLEQLRALEHGAAIQVLTTSRPSLGVDTPEDIPRAEAALSVRQKNPRAAD